MMWELAIITIIPVGVSTLAAFLRTRTRLVYWSMSVTLALALPVVSALTSPDAYASTPGDVVGGVTLFLLPVVAVFAVVRSKSTARWIAALLIGPLTFVGTLFLAIAIGVNLGLLHK